MGHEMFKGGVLETTVQKNRHGDSGIGRPEGPRALATVVRKPLVKSQG